MFDLSINETKEGDEGTYFCGTVKTGVVEFGSGTLLIFPDFEAEKTDNHPPTKMLIKSGDTVTLQCSVESLSCSEDHSVYWFRRGSGESHLGIIYTRGNRSDLCTRSSETGSHTQNCVYNLPKRNLSPSDAGTYYCAVAACGEILFGKRTEVNVKENNMWIVITLTTSNVISVIVIILLVGVLLTNRQNDQSSHIYQVIISSNFSMHITSFYCRCEVESTILKYIVPDVFA
ncbi:uncharacterized protein [Salminus brasiliensis]|uniref:uncharacterized protein n=1 Tax=Salminus brasiliensis TaxID=930266 RepID=UPI003B83A075